MIGGFRAGALAAAVALVLASRVVARADAPALGADPVLAALLAQSLEARPELAQAQAEVAAQHERVPQVGALPDPMLQIGVQNDGFTSWEVGTMETSYYSIMASQTLPWPGKLRLRGRIAELGASQAEQSVVRVRISTEAEVRRAYLNLIVARDRLALLDRLEAIWKKAATLAGIRYETGQGVQADVLRAQLELTRLKQRRVGLQVDADTQVQALNRLRGHPLGEPIDTTVHLAGLALPPLEDAADALARSPELAAARLGVTQAETSVALARKAELPDFTVSIGVMPRGGDFPTMWLANVSVPLPIFAGRKQRRAVAEGEARVVVSRKNIEGLEQLLRLRVEQRRTTLAALVETIRLYQDGLLVLSEATAETTLAQYGVGKVTFASVLEANAAYIADQDGYLGTLAAAHRLAIDRAEVTLAPLSPAGVGGLGSGPAAPTDNPSSSMSSM